MKDTSHALPNRSLWSLDTLSRGDLLALIDTAARLKQAAGAGVASLPLRGKNIALVGYASDADAANLMRAAAGDLGAQVAFLPAGGGLNSSARLLGRFYDAVDCTAMSPAELRAVERDAGVPVFNGLAGDDHPTRVLAALLALQEASSRPLDALRIGFAGDANTAYATALRDASARIGFKLHAASRGDTTAGDDFVLDASRSSRWALIDRKGHVDENSEHENRRYVLQALLLKTLT